MACAAALLAAPAHAEVPFSDGYPVTTKARVLPLSGVKAGARGVGYTVFRAAEVEKFEFEVLGIMRGMLGPGRDVILARLYGGKIEKSGVISGMSGSPVYIDDKLVGAVSYRFGSFPKDPIAGITPIESMLDIFGKEVEPPPETAPFSNPLRPAPAAIRAEDLRSRGLLAPLPLPPRPAAAGAARPIEVPLAMAGVPPAVIEAMDGRLQAAGFIAAASGARGEQRPSPRATKRLDPNERGVGGGVPAAPIAPGSPIAAVLMRGDLNISAVGTVTYVEDGRVLAFGHPFLGYGHVLFPMATAAVLNTLNSQSGSYKQSAAALEVGVIDHDRLTAITGRFDQIAPMVPVRIRVASGKTPTAAQTVNMDVEVVDHDSWMPMLLELAINSAASGRLGAETGGTVDFRATYQVGDRALTIEDTYSAVPPLAASALVARDLGTVASLIRRNGFQWAKVRSVDVEIRARRAPQIAYVEDLLPSKILVAPGETVKLQARLRRYRGGTIDVPLSIEVPRTAEGTVTAYVGGAVEVDVRDGSVYGGRIPGDLDDLLGILSERRPGRGLYGRIYLSRGGLRSDVDLMSSLPVSQRLTLSQTGGVRRRLVKEAFGPSVRVDVPDVVVGARAVTLQVVR